MILTKKSGGDFVPHPATDGLIQAVIVDVTDPKKMQSQYGERDVFKLVYESSLKDDEGRPFAVWSVPYSPSLHEKANFRKDLKKILGRDLTTDEEVAFDVEAQLIGRPVQIIVAHEEKDGKTYAQITHIMPDKTGNPLKPSGKFIREKDRKKKEGSEASYRKGASTPEDSGRENWQKVKVHVGKNAGLDLGDLDETAVRALIDKWLPKHKANEKSTADDRRLAAALDEAEKILTAANPY